VNTAGLHPPLRVRARDAQPKHGWPYYTDRAKPGRKALLLIVIPAQAGIHLDLASEKWISACAGMTS